MCIKLNFIPTTICFVVSHIVAFNLPTGNRYMNHINPQGTFYHLSNIAAFSPGKSLEKEVTLISNGLLSSLPLFFSFLSLVGLPSCLEEAIAD